MVILIGNLIDKIDIYKPWFVNFTLSSKWILKLLEEKSKIDIKKDNSTTQISQTSLIAEDLAEIIDLKEFR